MEELERRLAVWVDEGVISSGQAARIEELERRRMPPIATGPGSGALRERETRRTAVAEAVGYLGAVLALTAVGLIVSDVWPELRTGGQLALVGLLGVLALGAGQALSGQAAPAMARLTGVLWAAAAVAAAWFTGIVAAELVVVGPAATATGAGATATVVAVPLLLRRPGLPLHLVALAGAVVAATGALGLYPLAPDPFYDGLLVAAVGGVWFLLGRGRWIAPQRVAEVLGGLVALGGMQAASFGELRVQALGLGLLLAAGAVALAVQRDAQHLLIVGALGGFVLLPQLVVEVFGDAIGAPATLLIVGLLLVLLAVGLGRARREVAAAPEADR